MATRRRYNTASNIPEVNGNLALGFGYESIAAPLPRRIPAPAPRTPAPAPKVRQQPEARPVSRVKFSAVAVPLLLILLAFGVSVGLVSRYLVIARNNLTLQSIQQQISDERVRADDLRLELSAAQNVQYVELVATEQLGMVYPSAQQMRVISLVAPADVAAVQTTQDAWWLSWLKTLRSYLD